MHSVESIPGKHNYAPPPPPNIYSKAIYVLEIASIHVS